MGGGSRACPRPYSAAAGWLRPAEVVVEATLAGARLRLDETFRGYVIDQHLPDGRGLSFAIDLRARNARVPILLPTGDDDPALCARCAFEWNLYRDRRRRGSRRSIKSAPRSIGFTCGGVEGLVSNKKAVLQWKDAGPGLNPTEVRALEIRLGVKFPLEYSEFLGDRDGGRPIPRWFEAREHNERYFTLMLLFGVRRATRTSNVEWNSEHSYGLFERGWLPIGMTDTGDLVLMSLRPGKDFGSIAFYDLREDRQIYSLAPTLSDFLSSLTENPGAREGAT